MCQEFKIGYRPVGAVHFCDLEQVFRRGGSFDAVEISEERGFPRPKSNDSLRSSVSTSLR
jgi:hypothetical protein